MRSLFLSLVLAVAGTAASAAQDGIQLTDPQVQRWEIGLIVEATGACTGIVATVPVPMDWPEQQVREISRDVSSQVGTLRFRDLSDGARQMLIPIARLSAGERAQALLTFEITRSEIVGPQETAGWHIPTRPDRALYHYLGTSPQIETSDREIKRLAEQVVQDCNGDWDKAEAIYDWVREHVEYRFDVQLKGARAALRDGFGDCEELTSLFVAMCRVNRIPARSVWIPGHTYPEFYLEDAAGQGCWFPCQAAGTRAFGSLREYRPILQKGDDFKVPGERAAKRYVAETFRAQNALAAPRVEFIRRDLDAPPPAAPVSPAGGH
jgi:hypothetical protein